MVQSVPSTSGRTPYAGGLNRGAHFVPVRNSLTDTSWKNAIAGAISAHAIPIVISTDNAPQVNRPAMMTLSP